MEVGEVVLEVLLYKVCFFSLEFLFICFSILPIRRNKIEERFDLTRSIRIKCFLFAVTNELLAAGIARSQSPSGLGPIQPHEIAAALSAEGITIGALHRIFPGRIGDIAGQQTSKKEFIRLVKENSSYGSDKLLRPLPPK